MEPIVASRRDGDLPNNTQKSTKKSYMRANDHSYGRSRRNNSGYFNINSSKRVDHSNGSQSKTNTRADSDEYNTDTRTNGESWEMPEPDESFLFTAIPPDPSPQKVKSPMVNTPMRTKSTSPINIIISPNSKRKTPDMLRKLDPYNPDSGLGQYKYCPDIPERIREFNNESIERPTSKFETVQAPKSQQPTIIRILSPTKRTIDVNMNSTMDQDSNSNNSTVDDLEVSSIKSTHRRPTSLPPDRLPRRVRQPKLPKLTSNIPVGISPSTHVISPVVPVSTPISTDVAPTIKESADKLETGSEKSIESEKSVEAEKSICDLKSQLKAYDGTDIYIVPDDYSNVVAMTFTAGTYGLDTESDMRTGELRIIQIYNGERVYIFKASALHGFANNILIKFLSSKDRIKIGVDIDCDISKLREYLIRRRDKEKFSKGDIRPTLNMNGFIDLQSIARTLGETGFSLDKLSTKYVEGFTANPSALGSYIYPTDQQYIYSANDAILSLKIYYPLMYGKPSSTWSEKNDSIFNYNLASTNTLRSLFTSSGDNSSRDKQVTIDEVILNKIKADCDMFGIDCIPSVKPQNTTFTPITSSVSAASNISPIKSPIDATSNIYVVSPLSGIAIEQKQVKPILPINDTKPPRSVQIYRSINSYQTEPHPTKPISVDPKYAMYASMEILETRTDITYNYDSVMKQKVLEFIRPSISKTVGSKHTSTINLIVHSFKPIQRLYVHSDKMLLARRYLDELAAEKNFTEYNISQNIIWIDESRHDDTSSVNSDDDSSSENHDSNEDLDIDDNKDGIKSNNRNDDNDKNDDDNDNSIENVEIKSIPVPSTIRKEEIKDNLPIPIVKPKGKKARRKINRSAKKKNKRPEVEDIDALVKEIDEGSFKNNDSRSEPPPLIPDVDAGKIQKLRDRRIALKEKRLVGTASAIRSLEHNLDRIDLELEKSKLQAEIAMAKTQKNEMAAIKQKELELVYPKMTTELVDDEDDDLDDDLGESTEEFACTNSPNDNSTESESPPLVPIRKDMSPNNVRFDDSMFKVPNPLDQKQLETKIQTNRNKSLPPTRPVPVLESTVSEKPKSDIFTDCAQRIQQLREYVGNLGPSLSSSLVPQTTTTTVMNPSSVTKSSTDVKSSQVVNARLDLNNIPEYMIVNNKTLTQSGFIEVVEQIVAMGANFTVDDYKCIYLELKSTVYTSIVCDIGKASQSNKQSGKKQTTLITANTFTRSRDEILLMLIDEIPHMKRKYPKMEDRVVAANVFLNLAEDSGHLSEISEGMLGFM